MDRDLRYLLLIIGVRERVANFGNGGQCPPYGFFDTDLRCLFLRIRL